MGENRPSWSLEGPNELEENTDSLSGDPPLD